LATRAASATAGLGGLARFVELRRRLAFLVGALLVFRIGTHIPVPGIDPLALAQLFEQQRGTVLDMFNMFSGGALERLSVFALGVMPYISASIIVQLLSSVHPKLAELRKEGAAGRRKLTQYTRYGTVVLGAFQGLGIAVALEAQGSGGTPVVIDPGYAFRLITTLTLMSGTMFLVWLGEQITERGVGNGISMLIFAGIVAGLPQALGGTLELTRTGELGAALVLALFAVAVGVTFAVVFIERGQRRITVTYAQRQRGRQVYAAQNSHLPLKLNMAGVIPPIFASSLLLFPSTLGGWMGGGQGGWAWLRNVITAISPGQPLHAVLYGVGIVFFCFFYTSVVFNPKDTADNLKRSGAFVPGVRPGEQTARFIERVVTRLTAAGALYITAVCLLPEFLIVYWNVPFYFGGTSLLIVVVVVMDFMAQVQTHIMTHQYEGLLKKAGQKGRGGLFGVR
jgi:preprotein translocase subunit SecY